MGSINLASSPLRRCSLEGFETLCACVVDGLREHLIKSASFAAISDHGAYTHDVLEPAILLQLVAMVIFSAFSAQRQGKYEDCAVFFTIKVYNEVGSPSRVTGAGC